MAPVTNGYSAAIIDFLPDATLVIDAHGTVTGWNHAMGETTGEPQFDDMTVMVIKGV